MKSLLRKIVKIAAYLVATVVILLAIAVGLFRLMLPRLPEYQEQIKTWASAAIGMRVEFSDMNARWRLSGPELSFQNATLSREAVDLPLLGAEEVGVGVSLIRLLQDRELVADRILIRDADVSVELAEDGSWLIQDIPLDDIIGSRTVSADQAGQVSLDAQDIRVHYRHPGAGETLTFHFESIDARRHDDRLTVDALVEPPVSFGEPLKVSASQRKLANVDASWQFFVEGQMQNLAEWSRLQPKGLPQVKSGFVDINLWLQQSAAGLQSATANFVLDDLLVENAVSSIDASGTIEFAHVSDGWLLAANSFSLDLPYGDAWPQSSWQVQAGISAVGDVQSMSIGASFVRLQDLRALAPWLNEEWRQQLERFDADGVLRDFSFSRSALDTDSPVFEVAARMESAGLIAVDDWPGLRGFSGALRADSAGGRLEIDSENLIFSLPAELPDALIFDDAMGTIIWRRNAEGTIVLSDSIHLRNTDLNSQTSLQVSVPADGSSTVVDVRSDWSINNIGNVDRYLPMKAVKPALYGWLTSALVSGRIPRGTTRITGPMDRFPFDNDEGIFRIDAVVEDAELLYSDQWPAATNMNLDFVVDKSRLYSHRNTAVNAGNSVENARIEIADLREPVLEIDAFATGTLESIRDFSRNSPIANVFGGQLDRVEVDGDASFHLHLVFPISDKENYDFETRIRASNGSIRIQGFPAAVTELNGLVVVSRDDISSESLFGRFLDEPVDISLAKSGDELSQYTVIASATGTAPAAAIIAQLGAPLDGLISGAAPFRAQLYFPARREQDSAPFRIEVESQMLGFGVQLPPPFQKPEEDVAPLSFNVEISGGDLIETGGSFREELIWNLGFRKSNDRWDFDRGVLAVGGGYPGEAAVRGLHIEGQLDEIRLDDWLALGRRGTGTGGIGNRIRSVDVTVQRLDAIGQHLVNHRVVINRSADDWIVQLDGTHAVGSIMVPYEFSGGRPLRLDMQKLVLPGKEEPALRKAAEIDPRNLPSIEFRAGEFALGERNLGSVSAIFVKTPFGLESGDLVARDETFTIRGRAGWTVGQQDPSTQQSYIVAKLQSSDVAATMQRLNYEPGIEGQDMEIDFDLRWRGGPRQDYMSELDGNVGVRLGSGRLDDVEPGPGRVFGLMSIVALPRRLSLDFRDVLDKGFGFDEITGRFRLEDGVAYTCDLSLKGPAADVGIVGSAGLASRDYHQTAVVSANVGNTLPVVGAVVAGPQVAAALLIFSQIFKKPLQEMGQLYYAIEGSWEQPDVESTNAEHFAESSAIANCVQLAE
jgi:uncharacterized protein (TIGR02099 family)